MLNSEPWHRRAWFAVALLILAAPLGVAWMFERGLFSPRARMALAGGMSAVWLALIVIALVPSVSAPAAPNPAVYMIPAATFTASPAPHVEIIPAVTPSPSPTATPEPTPAPTPEPTPEPSPEPSSSAPAAAERNRGPEDMVSVTPSGKRYHFEDCSTLSRSKNISAITRAEAEARGLTPCQVCDP